MSALTPTDVADIARGRAKRAATAMRNLTRIFEEAYSPRPADQVRALGGENPMLIQAAEEVTLAAKHVVDGWRMFDAQE